MLATLIRNSLTFFWRTHAGVVAASAVSTAVIVGALVVGDCVRASLARAGQARLGTTHLAMQTGERYFRDALASELAIDAPMTALLQVPAVAVRPDGAARSNTTQLIGVTDAFWQLATTAPATPAEGEVLLSAPLANRLSAAMGDEVLLRVDRPGTLPRDMPLATDEDRATSLRATVKAIVPEEAMGGFALRSSPLPPQNAFVARDWLQRRLGLDGRANVLLIGGDVSPEKAASSLEAGWRLADAELDLRPLEGADGLELRSRRVLIDDAVGRALEDESSARALTYFVNEIRSEHGATPYSMVTALDGKTGLLPVNLGDDEIVINQWLADDLGTRAGDGVELRYFVIGADGALDEQSSIFTVRVVVPLSGPAADPQWMPDFPGLADAEHCRQWEPGVPIDLDRIREKDEQYWERYRGTPKAFVTLAAGQRMWRNRFGDLTSIRFASADPAATEASLVAALQPADFGLSLRPVRDEAERGSRDAIPFGQLFVSLSFLLVAVAVLLTAMLYTFGIEHRAAEIGTLLATGWSPVQVRRRFLAEGLLLCVVGSCAGAPLGVGYTLMVLKGLATIWRDAVAATRITFHFEYATVIGGAALGIVVAMTAMTIALWRSCRRPAIELLTGAEPDRKRQAASRRSLVLAVALTAAAIAWFLAAPGDDSQQAVLNFFGVGALVLVAGLLACRAWLAAPGRTRRAFSLGALGARYATRRSGRSLATVALLSSGVFLVIAVGANRLEATDPQRRDSGTGGFALFAESSLPVLRDLNTTEGRDRFGLDESDVQGVAFVPLRVRGGDDASCLNLNRAQRPRVLGVRADALEDRGAFRFVDAMSIPGFERWKLLDAPAGAAGAVPAVTDQATAVWALGLKLGDSIRYADERGAKVDLRIVGLLANSILQGNIVIGRKSFERCFPSETGDRMLLIDTPPGRAGEIASTLSRSAEDIGLEITATAERLNAFHAVQNTYLTIFQSLGGLALLLGSGGLGVVVLRNILERRSQLAVLRAVGFSRGRVRRLLVYEHATLLAAGLVIGTGASLIAVYPALRMSEQTGWIPPTMAMALAVLISGLVWITLTVTAGTRGSVFDALRRE